MEDFKAKYAKGKEYIHDAARQISTSREIADDTREAHGALAEAKRHLGAKFWNKLGAKSMAEKEAEQAVTSMDDVFLRFQEQLEDEALKFEKAHRDYSDLLGNVSKQFGITIEPLSISQFVDDFSEWIWLYYDDEDEANVDMTQEMKKDSLLEIVYRDILTETKAVGMEVKIGDTESEVPIVIRVPREALLLSYEEAARRAQEQGVSSLITVDTWVEHDQVEKSELGLIGVFKYSDDIRRYIVSTAETDALMGDYAYRPGGIGDSSNKAISRHILPHSPEYGEPPFSREVTSDGGMVMKRSRYLFSKFPIKDAKDAVNDRIGPMKNRRRGGHL